MAGDAAGEVLEYLEWAGEREAREALEACMACRLCDSVCPTRRASGDPRLAPWERLRRAARIILEGRVEEGDVEVLYTCLLCGLCSLACPYGLRIWLLSWLARHRLATMGRAPRGLREVAESAARNRHSFTSDPRRALSWAKAAGIVLDEPAEALYTPSPLENTVYSTRLAAKARALQRLGVEYTVSSRVLDIGGNASFDASRPDIGLQLLEEAVEEAERLGAKTIIVGECGSDAKQALILGPLLAEKMGKQVVFKSAYQAVAEKNPGILEEALRETILFTSCNMFRFTDAGAPLLRSRAKTPRDKRPYTSCCGGGGGLTINQEPWARRLRRAIAVERLKRLPAETITVPCVKCYTALREAALITKTKARIMTVLDSLAQTPKRPRNTEKQF